MRRPGPRGTLAIGLIGLCGLAFSVLSRAEPARGEAGVLVELFSSEGCSSCPPADEALRELDGSRTLAGGRVFALEFHVDYWDDLGWKDPFSREEWSARQRGYATVKVGGMYTPGMVVDGRDGFVGSDRAAARAALDMAARRRHVDVSVSRDGSALRVRVPKVEGPASSVWLAVAERGLETRVLHGENAGRTLLHAPVVRELTRIAQDAARGVDVMVQAPLKPHTAYVVFVQRNESREVLGAAGL